MSVRSSIPARRAATVGLTALVLSLTAGPAFAVGEALDPLVDSLAVTEASPSPSPSPSPSSLVPEPLRPVVDPVVEAVKDVVPLPAPSQPAPAPAPAPAPVPAPAPAPVTAPAPAAEPAPVAGQGTSPQQVEAPRQADSPVAGGTGNASLGSLGGFVAGFGSGSGSAGEPALGAPMLAAAPAFTLPGLPEPMTAPEPADVVIAQPVSSPVAPAGLPVLVVAVAGVALVAAAGGHAAELRARRVPISD